MATKEQLERMQDEAWPVGIQEWGDDRYGVRNYLQTEWEKYYFTKALDFTSYNVSETAKMVIDHWYNLYQRQKSLFLPTPGKNSVEFSQWLYQQYKDYTRKYLDQRYDESVVIGRKLNPPDNKPLPPRQLGLNR